MCDVFKTALKSEGYQNRTTSSSVISGNWLEDYFCPFTLFCERIVFTASAYMSSPPK